jgi:hypothetical protein
MDKINFHELKIHDHEITIWDDRFIILRHPEKCDVYEDDHCREKMLKYLADEGLIISNDGGILIIDSYIDFEP